MISENKPDQPKPTPPVVNVHANVIAEDDGNTIKYRLEPRDDKSERYVTGATELTFPNGPERYKVHFHIVDEGCSYNLKFKGSMPICAEAGETCPLSGGINTDQLRADGPPSEKFMGIENCNSTEGPVSFALFFKDQNTKEDVDPFDPIMQNGGGGTTFSLR